MNEIIRQAADFHRRCRSGITPHGNVLRAGEAKTECFAIIYIIKYGRVQRFFDCFIKFRQSGVGGVVNQVDIFILIKKTLKKVNNLF